MKTVARTMEVSRSHQYEKQRAPLQKEKRFYCRKDDERYHLLIREIIDDRPTYGYRRVTALMNRRLRGEGEATVNHKRVYRIMKKHQLLMQRHTGRPVRAHNGQVVVPFSNHRWCSDAFEIACRNGERVRVAFSLDCCDREVMSYVATTGGISGDLIRDLMAESIEGRFGLVDKVPQRIQWLSDNGPAYIARETRSFAKTVGLKSVRPLITAPNPTGWRNLLSRPSNGITFSFTPCMTPGK
jgi:putative transposase